MGLFVNKTVILGTVALIACPPVVRTRNQIKLDFDWRFMGFESTELNQPTDFLPSQWAAVADIHFNDSSWRPLDVPHDFVIEGTFNPDDKTGRCTDAINYHGYLPLGVGWYRKTFRMEPGEVTDGQSAWLDFEGVFRDSTVWFNGQMLGNHQSGYTSFRYHLNNATHTLLKPGNNVLVVRADATQMEGWFYEGGGIYRHVWLTIADPVHVEPWGIYIMSELQSEPINGVAEVTLNVNTTLRNSAGSKRWLRVQQRVLDSLRNSVGYFESNISLSGVPLGGTMSLQQVISLGRLKLWSIADPVLYLLVTVVEDLATGTRLDEVTTRFGPRQITFDSKTGMYLNGQHVKIQGMANHMDFAGVGNAVPYRLQLFKIKAMQAMGVNAWRCAHNPPNPEFLDAADELGLLVLDENRHFGFQPTPHILPEGHPAAWEPEYMADFRSMILRDRNHPSIFAWSLCNEPECYLENNTRSAEAGAAYKKILKELDPLRNLTGGMIHDFGKGVSTVFGIQGFNYNPNFFDDYHSQFPEMPMMSTETYNGREDRGEYNSSGYASSFDLTQQSWWRNESSRAFMAGGFAWTGFDYKGESHWPSVNANFGVLDMSGFPKDKFFWYQAYWSKEPVLHVLPGVMDSNSSLLMVFSNADEVELLLDNRSLGRQVVPKFGHQTWHVASNAHHQLTAHGFRNNESLPFITVVQETPGLAYAVQLTLELDQQSMMADRQDIAIARAAIVDKEGRLVSNSAHTLSFTVDGPAQVIGVGNGDPHSHEADRASSRRSFHGLVRVIVQSTGDVGQVTLHAKADGLQSGIIVFDAVAAKSGDFANTLSTGKYRIAATTIRKEVYNEHTSFVQYV